MLLPCVFLGLTVVAVTGPEAATSFCAEEDWVQIWKDDFESELDSSIWTKDVRGPGDSRTRDAAAIAQNVFTRDGALVIRSNATWNSSSGSWANLTSGAVQSKHKRSFSGKTRVCVRAKLPGGGGTDGAGHGVWPAHWLMPDDTSCWPSHGEIDVMEMINGDGVLHGTYHWAVNSTCGDGPTHMQSGGQTGMGKSPNWSAEWHEFAVEYDLANTDVKFALDGHVYHKVETTALTWNVPFYIILNTALGGPWPGPPDAEEHPVTVLNDQGVHVSRHTVFPTYHLIDWVHVAQPAVKRVSHSRR